MAQRSDRPEMERIYAAADAAEQELRQKLASGEIKTADDLLAFYASHYVAATHKHLGKALVAVHKSRIGGK